MHIEFARQIFVVVFIGVAAWFDVRNGRIPNWLSVAGFAAGLVWALFFANPESVSGQPLLALAIGFGAMLILYVFKGVGAGDVKLMAGFSLLTGYPGIIYCLFFGCLAAGALMLAPLAWRGELAARLRAGLRRGKDAGEAESLSVSFALALLIGVVWVLVMEAV